MVRNEEGEAIAAHRQGIVIGQRSRRRPWSTCTKVRFAGIMCSCETAKHGWNPCSLRRSWGRAGICTRSQRKRHRCSRRAQLKDVRLYPVKSPMDENAPRWLRSILDMPDLRRHLTNNDFSHEKIWASQAIYLAAYMRVKLNLDVRGLTCTLCRAASMASKLSAACCCTSAKRMTCRALATAASCCEM